MGKNKKAQTIQVIIMMIVGLVVLGMLIYLGYKYILGPGEDIEKLGSCKGQGGQCKVQCSENEKSFYGIGCPEKEGDPEEYCCIPQGK